jgi:hypothetical protein
MVFISVDEKMKKTISIQNFIFSKFHPFGKHLQNFLPKFALVQFDITNLEVDLQSTLESLGQFCSWK